MKSKVYSYLILTLFCISCSLYVYAHPLEYPLPELTDPWRWCQLHWVAPTEREDDTPLAPNKIATFNIEINNGGWEPINNTVISNMRHIFWVTDKPCPACNDIRINTEDTDGRTSDWAHPTCPPTQPTVCE